MLVTFQRLKRILPVIIIILVALTVSTYVASVRSAIDPLQKVANFFHLGDGSTADEPIDDGYIDDEDDAAEDESAVEPKSELFAQVITDDESYTVSVQEARTDDEIRQGLMYVEDLCEECGMVFYFDHDVRSGFWMRNCLISLDIIFIDAEGVIVDIKENFEPCPGDPCPSHTPPVPYRYVLEVNGGWADRYDVGAGDEVVIP